MVKNKEINKIDSSHVSAEQIINEIQSHTEIFRSLTGEAFIKAETDNSIVPLDSTEFECWLRKFCFYQLDDIYLSSGIVQQVTGYLKMFAENGEMKELHRRICVQHNTVYYDLGLDGCHFLKITEKGITTVKNSKILMRRSNVFCRQVMPDLEGEPWEIPEFVEKHFHFSSASEKVLFSVFLVASFFFEVMPMPLIQLYGEKASGKTSCEKRILDLLNPVSTGVFALPKRLDDIAMCLSADYMVAFDNIGWINEAVSNLFCLACTGGIIPKRKLFTDNTQMFRSLKSIVIFNSVNQCVTKSDLADRILTFHLERFSQEDRRGELELKEEWEQDKPRFFGAICRAVQGIIGDDEPIKYCSPFRLVDFYMLAVKVGRQIGIKEDEIYEAFEENHNTVNEAIVSGDIVLTAIEQFMMQYSESEILVFNPTDFYRELKDYACGELRFGYADFPRSPASLTRKIGANRSNLEDIGIYFETGRATERYIKIWKE